MSARRPTVLVVNASREDANCLFERLLQWGCECHTVRSCEEAETVLRARAFDVVLSPINLPDGHAYHLVPLVLDRPCTFFFSQSVEDGCWWIPAVEDGQQCLGTRALRPSEFCRRLDQLFRGIAAA